MRKSKFHNQIAGIALSLTIGLGALVASPFVVSSDASAQSRQVNGVRLNQNLRQRSGVRQRAGVRQRIGQRANSDRFNGALLRPGTAINRTGVVNSGVQFNNGFNQVRRADNRRLIIRERQISRRNQEVLIRNEQRLIQSTNRRTRPNGRLLSSQDGGAVLNDGFEDTGVISSGQLGGIDCPVNYNCGYRIYSNGTGPRIITLD